MEATFLDYPRGSMPTDLDQVRADFDRIAEAGDPPYDHGARLYPRLLEHVPDDSIGLDLGCGTGEFTRLLRTRCRRVVGLDLSPRMVATARHRSAGLSGVDYRVGDFLLETLDEQFDVVVSISTLHHVPLDAALARAASWVKPGGSLLVADLYRPVGVVGFFENAISFPWARLREWQRPVSAQTRAAWRAHKRHDRIPTIAEIREAASRVTPGAAIRKHLYWRWSLVWRKPEVE